MEESKKKPIMIAFIIVCFALACVIAYKYSIAPEETGKEVFKGQLVWIKCSKPDCETTYQMDMKEYFDTVERLTRENPMSMQTPPLVCEKCGQESGRRAEKCANAKCGIIFFRGAAGRGEFADKCPECGYSKSEELRKQAREEARGGG